MSASPRTLLPTSAEFVVNILIAFLLTDRLGWVNIQRRPNPERSVVGIRMHFTDLSMALQHFETNTPLPFSAAVRAGGFLFVSGTASVNEQGKVVHDTFENEARRTYQNLSRILAAAGLDFARVVQVRCYLARQDDWDEHNRIYREFFKPPYPARTTLVGCLGDLVKYEVDLVAYAGDGPAKD